MTFETPGIVFDLWHHVTLLQAEVENFRLLLLLLHLITVITAKATTQERVSFVVTELVREASCCL